MKVKIKDINVIREFSNNIGDLLPLYIERSEKVTQVLNEKIIDIQRIKSKLKNRLDDSNMKLVNRNNEYTLCRARQRDNLVSTCYGKLWKVQLAKTEQRAARKNLDEIQTIESFALQEMHKYKQAESQFRQLMDKKSVRTVAVLNRLYAITSEYLSYGKD